MNTSVLATSLMLVFRMSLPVEPVGIDPARINSSESNYFLVNVLRGLYRVDGKGDLQPELAKDCRYTHKHEKIKCTLRRDIRWSDGKPIQAKDVEYSWRRILSPESKGQGAAVLSGVKNAAKVRAGQLPLNALGIRALNAHEIEVNLESEDFEFIEKLAHPALALIREGAKYDRENAASAPVSGPYRVSEWKPGGRIQLLNNINYFKKVARPTVEILIVEDDETALNLYREGTLTFLRRLPTHYLKDYRQSPELFQLPVVRFDYLGFGPNLRGQGFAEFRQALVSSLNYQELKKLYDALGMPGCPSLSPTWMTSIPCHQFDLKRAQGLWAKVPETLKTKRWTLNFSKAGGDDIAKGMEWIQAQWKKNLGFNVDLRSVEQGVYLQELRTAPPDLFRKGVGLDRATCLAAVEVFSQNDPENYIHLNSKVYEQRINDLKLARSTKAKKAACTRAVQYLVDEAEVIPLGQMHFSILAKPQFKGWVLNPLNQLDLTGLNTQ